MHLVSYTDLLPQLSILHWRVGAIKQMRWLKRVNHDKLAMGSTSAAVTLSWQWKKLHLPTQGLRTGLGWGAMANVLSKTLCKGEAPSASNSNSCWPTILSNLAFIQNIIFLWYNIFMSDIFMSDGGCLWNRSQVWYQLQWEVLYHNEEIIISLVSLHASKQKTLTWI